MSDFFIDGITTIIIFLILTSLLISQIRIINTNHPLMRMNTLLILAALFFSCKENSRNPAEMEYLMAPQDVKISQKDSYNLEDASFAEAGMTIASQKIINRKLIRNGSIDFKVAEVKKTKIEIEKICKELDAYTSNESENNFGDRLQYNQTIRVPADKFDILLTKIESLALKVENKNISTEDVTEEFIDVEARLSAKKELETRYLEILKQAKTVEEIISVESQIANVRSEIESMQGRLEYLKNQVSLSTINVSYYETLGTDFGFINKLGESLREGWQNLLSFVILLITLWPFGIALGLILIWWKKRKKSKEAN